MIGIKLRDLELFKSLMDSRVMTLKQIAILHFNGKYESAKKYVQKLKRAGFLSERDRHVNEPSVLILTQDAYDALVTAGALPIQQVVGWSALARRIQVATQTLQHELEIVDFKAALGRALKDSPRLNLAEFSSWPVLNEFNVVHPRRRQLVKVRPDGFIRINGEAHESIFFLEHDRSTETLETLTERCLCYLAHYRSGGFALRVGQPQSSFKEIPFRVLVVCKTDERRNNLAERLLQGIPPVLTHTWLTTLHEATTTPLAAIWIRPLDYQQITQNTLFDPSNQKPSRVYRRKVERDAFIETCITKHLLLETGKRSNEEATS